MIEHCVVRPRAPSPHLVSDTFTVQKIVKRARQTGRVWWMSLAGRTEIFEAIAGPSTPAIAAGDIVHVHACILQRRGQSLLVICSLNPTTCADPEDQ